MCIFLVTLAYATVKVIHLQSRHNPQIVESSLPSFYANEDMLNMQSIGFKAAFSFVNYLDKELKDDPRYVKWIFRARGTRDGVSFERILDAHKCTRADFEGFNEMNERTKTSYDTYMRNSESTGMYCLKDEDWADLVVGGEDSTA